MKIVADAKQVGDSEVESDTFAFRERTNFLI